MVDFRHEGETYDVAILGSGLGGSALAAILARQGHTVLLLEKGAHPRFAAGEAMLPQSSMLLWILGERFGFPEIQHLSNSLSIRQHVSSESHLFRAEIDQYMVAAAVRHGAVYRERIDICDLEIGDEGAVLRSTEGEELRARFLVDVSGPKSLLASTLDLREEPTHLRTQLAHAAGLVDALYFGDLRLFRTCLKYLETRDVDHFERPETDPLPRSSRPGDNLTEDLLDAGEALLAAVEEGVISADEAAERIFEHLHLAPLPPVYGWSDPQHLDFTVAVRGGMAEASAPMPVHLPREQLAIAMA